ncbi:hypothetical protein [Brachybacterium vulturis]|uniref:hypothetical protein n=1 Tax=Brachybacterium vulturis TaxID=2017484 RepID=UPI003734C8D5
MRADHDLDVVLMVGTGGSDAWVSVVGDRPVLFVALEMLGDPERDTLLVLHELVHVVHVRALLPRLQADPGLEHHVGMRVWLEGVAVAGTRRLRPGLPDSAYFFIPDDGWGDACRAALPRLAGGLLPHLDTTDPVISYSFCGVTDQHPWPSRAGYWVGDAIVSELLDSGHELSPRLMWGPTRVTQAIRESLDPERPPEGRAR